MKITKTQLKQIIKEEIESTLEESPTRTKLMFNDGEYDNEIHVQGADSVETRSEGNDEVIVINGKIKVILPSVESLEIVR
jgi:hypothetical protein